MDEQPANTSGPTGRARRSRTRRALAGVAVTAAVAAGGLTIAAVNPLGIAGAQDGGSTTSTVSAPRRNASTPMAGRATKVLDQSLAALVKDGTLTQAQADAVKAEVVETSDSLRSEQRTRRKERRQAMESTAAATLGMSAADLRTELKAGRTLAQVAQEKGVDPQKVIDALVAQADKRIDQAVSDGTVDATRAATMKQNAATRIQSLVTNGPRHRQTPAGSGSTAGG
ncbi:MAG: hypothetical protein JST64_05825 [Actinobacteria bacterium]|nr:hypothetical protein [Actinomycetota bacterium]